MPRKHTRTHASLKQRRAAKVALVMREGYAGHLHSGSKRGPIVTNPKQIVAIALSEARRRVKRRGHR